MDYDRLRMSDIVKLKKQDILTAKNPRIVEQMTTATRLYHWYVSLAVVKQKTGKTRILYLGSLQDLIQDYTKTLDPEDYLFPSSKGGHLEVNTVYQMFQKVAKLLGRDDICTDTITTIRKLKTWLHS